jgi:hypothetical protein
VCLFSLFLLLLMRELRRVGNSCDAVARRIVSRQGCGDFSYRTECGWTECLGVELLLLPRSFVATEWLCSALSSGTDARTLQDYYDSFICNVCQLCQR